MMIDIDSYMLEIVNRHRPKCSSPTNEQAYLEHERDTTKMNMFSVLTDTEIIVLRFYAK
jgi:hypothetical protein